MRQTKFYNIYEQAEGKRRALYTRNLANGISVYGEKLVKEKGEEYREWDATRSKLASFILKGADQIALKPDDVVLYLGASTGTTVSHVSDIVGSEGFIFAVDFAPRVVRNLIFLAEQRKNIAPIIADANKPEGYIDRMCEVDFLYQDVAQRNQTEIFLKNSEIFLKQGGFGMLAVKARSVDVTKQPKDIFQDVRKELEKKMRIIDYRLLEPFQKDHCLFLCKK